MKHLKVLVIWNWIYQISISSHGKLLPVLSQATVYIFSFQKIQKNYSNPRFLSTWNKNCSMTCRIASVMYLNLILRRFIRWATVSYFSNKVPLFENTEIGFLKMLSMKIKPVYFLAKEYVVRKGDIGQEVRIVWYTAIPQIFAHAFAQFSYIDKYDFLTTE